MKNKHTLKRKRSAEARNTVAMNPLLGKGGRHEKSTKAKRQQQKMTMKKTWFERVAAVTAVGSSHVFSCQIA